MSDSGQDGIEQDPGRRANIDRLYASFVRRPENAAIGSAIENALDATMRGPEARGVVLTAPSGAGKTAFLERFFKEHARLGEDAGSPCRFIRMKVKSPCSLKDLGRAVAAKAGYQIRNTSLDAPAIWGRARTELSAAKIRLVLLDEIQNITAPAKKGDDQLIRDTLKTLLIDSDWPVALVLAGQPSVASFLEEDAQVVRRMTFTSIAPLDAEKNADDVSAVIRNYCALMGLKCDEDEIRFLVPRLVHSAGQQFGWAIEILREAIRVAVEGKQQERLTREHFASEYAKRTGNAAFANPFLATDWFRLDPKRRNITSIDQIVEEDPPPPRSIKRRPKK